MSEENASLATLAGTEPWASRTIGDTGKYINGLAFKPTDWGDEGMPIIRIQNLTNPTKPLNRTTRAVDPAYVVNPGDILVSWSATLDAFIWNREPGLLNQHIFKVVPYTSVVTKKFLFYMLKKAIAEMIKSEHLHGSTMKHINRGPFLAHKVEVPTLEQQVEIVAELEKQFSRLDEAVANLQRVKANLKRYKASVLKAAVEGRLVETEASLAHREGRTYETGAQLLLRILEERRAKWAGRGSFTADPPSELQEHVPDGWTVASLDQLCTVVRGGSPRPAGDPKYFGGTVPWITVGSITVDETDYLRYANGGLTEEGKERSRFIEQHTLLLTNSGATLGVPKISLIAGCINDGVAALLDVEYPLKHYLVHYLRTRTDALRQVNQGAAQPNLNTTIIKSMVVPLPPLAEQSRILAEVDRHLSIIREVEAEVDANLQRAQALRQATLAKAFSPVPFDPVQT